MYALSRTVPVPPAPVIDPGNGVGVESAAFLRVVVVGEGTDVGLAT